ncbi:MAG: Maf family nucleotide pyrophosphatase [Bacteroidota bacterium]
MKTVKIILGSGSPRRKQLLSNMGFEVEVYSLDIDESYPVNLPCEEIADYISARKMEALKEMKNDSSILLTADTTVILKKHILGKPSDRKNAKLMLKELSGKIHSVNTAVKICYKGKTIGIRSFTDVFFNKLNDEQIDFYVSQFNPFDKAGAYGIQDWLGLICVNKIRGSYTNVVGLPTDECYNSIHKLLNS